MQKTLLVVGSAPCLHEDVAKALALRPAADIMLVNGACTALENADHILSGHTDKAEYFAAARRAAFPNAHPWRVHATIEERFRADAAKLYPSVTDWWEKDVVCGATSIGKAILIGLRKLGCDEIIVCGAPMDGSGYAPTEAIVPHNCDRIGDPTKQDRRAIEGYRRKFKKLSETDEVKGRVFSMSGFTRLCLGEPR